MNVRSTKKRFEIPTYSDQSDISFFQESSFSADNVIPKEHVGNVQDNPLIPKQTDNQTIPLIHQRKYSKTNIDENQHITRSLLFYTDEDPISLVPEDLFDDPASEDNTTNLSSITQEPISKPTEITENEIHEVNAEKNSLDPYKNIGIMSIKKQSPAMLKKSIEEHPLTPIVEEWAKQKSNVYKTQLGYRNKMRKFIVFLIGLNVEHPTTYHLLIYKHVLSNGDNLGSSQTYMSVVRSFFKWAKSNNKYEDILQGTYDKDISTNK